MTVNTKVGQAREGFTEEQWADPPSELLRGKKGRERMWRGLPGKELNMQTFWPCQMQVKEQIPAQGGLGELFKFI